jgi:MoaA/NifB/PqqE/SkfB family radical SAM enzyme
MIPRPLRLLVMHVSTRCDQACAHCSIWRGSQAPPKDWGVEKRLAVIQEAQTLGARAVLFTGGEPLLCDHIETLARETRRLGLTVQIATNGLGLQRSASWLATLVDELYVSLEGPQDVHDSIRGRGMFMRLHDSLRALTAWDVRPRLIARSVVSERNADVIDRTVDAARDLGFDGLSYLPIDLSSDAFGGPAEARAELRPTAPRIKALRQAIDRMQALGHLGGFVLEDAEKLSALADGFESADGPAKAPRCNAPEWSAVVEADGAVRPCFFQPATGNAVSGLASSRASAGYVAALRGLGAGNRICASCVCPKYVPRGLDLLRGRVGRALGWMTPHAALRAGSRA